MRTEKYYLGIDGGGTKTDFMLCTADGRVVNRCILAGCNPVDIGMERTKEILTEGISAVCGNIPYGEVIVYAGIAGGISGDNQEKLRAFLLPFGFARAQNSSDAMNAAAAGLNGRDGVAVVIGTGSVAFTKHGREYLRTGGFGYLLDKGGDGYSIGRDALHYALYAEQRGEKETLLLRLLQEKAGGEILPRLGGIYAGGKAYIASYCPAVFEAFRGGDETAERIIDQNMALASELILEAAKKPDSKACVTVRLIGGVAKQPETVPWIKKHADQDRSVALDIAFADIEPVRGAVLLAMEEDENAED